MKAKQQVSQTHKKKAKTVITTDLNGQKEEDRVYPLLDGNVGLQKDSTRNEKCVDKNNF